MFKKTVCVDFDGVLNTYCGNYDPNYLCEPAPGAGDFLRELSKRYKVIIYSTREKSKIKEWLIKHNFLEMVDEISSCKPPAFVYVDDRAILHKGDFINTLCKIKSFVPFWYDFTPNNI